jgi:hypothetical protein
MTEVYPQVPLAERLGLGIALFSYDGRIHWGFNADWDVVPDLARFVADVGDAFGELREAAGLGPPAKAKPRKARAAAARANGGGPAAETG